MGTEKIVGRPLQWSTRKMMIVDQRERDGEMRTGYL
jgi:hypothetical protein